MALKDRIKEARLNKGFTQEQLSTKLNIAKSTLAGYETGNRKPDIDMIAKIMQVLEVDANYLWQDETDFPMQVSYEEMELIKKYRSLDDYGKETLNLMIEREAARSKLNASHIIPASSHVNASTDNMITFSFSSFDLNNWNVSNISDMSTMFNSVTVLPPYSKLPPKLKELLDESPDGLWTEAQLTDSNEILNKKISKLR